jgi:hypothetical protein
MGVSLDIYWTVFQAWLEDIRWGEILNWMLANHIEMLGWFGFILSITGSALTSWGVIPGDSKRANFMILFASISLMIYAHVMNTAPFVAQEFAWAVVATIGLIRAYIKG